MPPDAATPIAPFPEGGALGSRRRRRMEQWRQRSRLIQLLRRALPAGIVAILVLLAGWVMVRGVLIHLGDRSSGGGVIHMTNAHFYGREGDGKAYVLGAAEATRDDFDAHRFWLTMPVMVLNAGGAKESHISADHGVYREDTRMLNLHDHVSLRDPDGDVFNTNQAIVDTAKDSIVGQGQVWGTGPTGTITANSFIAFNQGQRVEFLGEVHSVMKRD